MKNNLIHNLKLTKKEEEIMMVLWDAKRPLTVSDISDHAKTMQMNLNQSTIQMSVNKLLKGGIIRVGEISQAYKVLARAFEPTISPDELAVLKFKQAINPSGNTKTSGLVAALLEHIELSNEDIQELSDMIEKMKRK